MSEGLGRRDMLAGVGFSALFQRGADDPMYQRVLGWIKQVYGQGN